MTVTNTNTDIDSDADIDLDTDSPTASGCDAADTTVLASWAQRGFALAVDILPAAAMLATTALVALSVPLHGAWRWVCMAIGAVTILWVAFNRLVAPSTSGQSLGRAVVGITVVRRDGGAVGAWSLLLRDLAHLLDTVPVLAGWLWPLVDSRRRTFADLLLGTQARVCEPTRPDRTPRRRATALLIVAAAVCAGGAAVSYTVVRQHDQSVTEATAQISQRGPHMVEQILSYFPDTIGADFERARSLATDKYRADLTAQQEAVAKSTAVRNEYWVTNSSVLSATPDQVTMLMFLQGQRGAPPAQRYITASVRVAFAKSGTGEWKVDDVAVVTEPQATEAIP